VSLSEVFHVGNRQIEILLITSHSEKSYPPSIMVCYLIK